MQYQKPPKWQPDAIPTPRGWRHPRTGELLVSIKLDMSQFEDSVEEDLGSIVMDALKPETLIDDEPKVEVIDETEKEELPIDESAVKEEVIDETEKSDETVLNEQVVDSVEKTEKDETVVETKPKGKKKKA